MSARHVFVTGGNGCIGSVTIRDLLKAGVERVTVATRSAGRGSLPLWLEEPDYERVTFAALDLADRDAIHTAVDAARPTHVIHLGAFQTPDCEAHPDLGMQVNVGGTMHLLAASADCGSVERFVFASSAAVYGLRDRYPGPTVSESEELAPPNLYGVWKVAGEQLARQFHERTGIATVSLRLNTTYGPGRDRGKTAAGTEAIKATARGIASGSAEPFRMPYGGRENYHYVEDVGAAFAQSALEPFEGHAALNIRGTTLPVTEFLGMVTAAAAERGHEPDLGLAEDAAPNPFVCDLDESAILARFPQMPKTPVSTGIDRTLKHLP